MFDVLSPLPTPPEGLREAAQVGALVPFIGAGASQLAGCPGWAPFADAALNALIVQRTLTFSQFDQVRHLNPRVKLSLARMLEKEHKTPIDYKAILHPRERHLQTNGLKLYSALFRFANVFVTTNYDEWLDERIPEPPASPATPTAPSASSAPALTPIRVVHRVSDLTPALLSETNIVIHLHGSLQDPGGMILTTHDYLDHYANDRSTIDPTHENRVLTFLTSLFASKTVLFIGYGLEELEILEYVILKARRRSTPGADAEARHYLLQGFFSHEESLMRHLKSYYLRECGIALVPFLKDDKGYEQLIDVVEHFARTIPASAPFVLEKAREMKALLDG